MSPIEITASTPNWKSLEGSILDGGYELREILEADDSSASFRVRVLGDYSQRAFATFCVAAEDAENDQVAIWETLRQLKSPHLNGPVAAGAMTIAEIPTEYLVLPASDEMLAGVLQHRALTEDEARELMNSMVRALETLHLNGFVHGRVSPERIVSAGAAIQLTTLGVRRINALSPINLPPGKYLAPESVEQNTTTAADVWCLGATLLETLTKVTYAPEMDLVGLPLPAGFRRVIESCLDPDPEARCALPEISPLYRQAPLRPRRAQASGATAQASVAGALSETKPVAIGAVAAAGSGARVPAPAMESLPAVDAGTQPHAATPYEGPILVHRRAAPDTPEGGPAREGGRGKGWLYGGIGVLLLLAIFLVFRFRHAAKQPTVTKNGPAAVTSSSEQNQYPTKTLSPEDATKTSSSKTSPPAPSKTPPPAPPKTLSPAAASAPTASPAPSAATRGHAGAPLHGSIWRVVLYTYDREADAQKKVDGLNQKHAGLGAEVFSPKGNGGLYLVVAGGKMTRDEAAQMRRTALRMGMPHDTYIQNYDH